MIETFCIMTMLFTIGYFIAKGAGRKISRLTAPNSGCSVTMADDLSHYVICYLGPNHHVEYEWVEFLQDDLYWNRVESLELDKGMFEASITREDYNHVQYKKDTVRAATLKDLSERIEKRFEEWNKERQIEQAERIRKTRISESDFLKNRKSNFTIG